MMIAEIFNAKTNPSIWKQGKKKAQKFIKKNGRTR